MSATETADKSSMLRPRVRVMVYQKPVTKEQPEGVAKLHRFEGHHGADGNKHAMSYESYYPQGQDGPERRLYLFSVKFSDGPVVDRWISPDDIQS